MFAEKMGLNVNSFDDFKVDKNIITRTEDRMNQFQRFFSQYIEPELIRRDTRAVKELQEIPDLMEEMIAHLSEKLGKADEDFKTNISRIIQLEREKAIKLKQEQLPQRQIYLKNTYDQLAKEIRDCKKDPVMELEVSKKYTDIFKQLDSDFERDFNKYDTISRLHRLIEQNSDKVVAKFVDLLDSNLRVDFNVKSSFRETFDRPAVPRLHSFQWNQKHVQVFRPQK